MVVKGFVYRKRDQNRTCDGPPIFLYDVYYIHERSVGHDDDLSKRRFYYYYYDYYC